MLKVQPMEETGITESDCWDVRAEQQLGRAEYAGIR